MQGLLQGILEVTVMRLHGPVLVGLAGIVAAGAEAVMAAQLAVARRDIGLLVLALAGLVRGGRRRG